MSAMKKIVLLGEGHIMYGRGDTLQEAFDNASGEIFAEPISVYELKGSLGFDPRLDAEKKSEPPELDIWGQRPTFRYKYHAVGKSDTVHAKELGCGGYVGQAVRRPLGLISKADFCQHCFKRLKKLGVPMDTVFGGDE